MVLQQVCKCSLFMGHCSILHLFFFFLNVHIFYHSECCVFCLGFAVAQTSLMTVEQGKPATLLCLVKTGFSRRQLMWYKQSAGDSLKLITSLRPHVNLTFGPGFIPSRFQIRDDYNKISLTILETTPEDEGMYHCALMDWMDVIWSTTYLSIKGKKIYSDLELFSVLDLINLCRAELSLVVFRGFVWAGGILEDLLYLNGDYRKIMHSLVLRSRVKFLVFIKIHDLDKNNSPCLQ